MKRIACITLIIAIVVVLSASCNYKKISINNDSNIKQLGKMFEGYTPQNFTTILNSNTNTNQLLLSRFVENKKLVYSLYNYSTEKIIDIHEQDNSIYTPKLIDNGNLLIFTLDANYRMANLKIVSSSNTSKIIKDIDISNLVYNCDKLKDFTGEFLIQNLQVSYIDVTSNGRYAAFSVFVNDNGYDVVVDINNDKVEAVFKHAMYFYFLDNTKILHARILPEPSDLIKANPVVGPAYRGEGGPKYDFIYEVYDLITSKTFDLPVDEKISSYLELRKSANNKFACIAKDYSRYIFSTNNMSEPIFKVNFDNVNYKSYEINSIINEQYYIGIERSTITSRTSKKLQLVNIKDDSVVKNIVGEYSYFKVMPDNKIFCVGDLEYQKTIIPSSYSIYLIDI